MKWKYAIRVKLQQESSYLLIKVCYLLRPHARFGETTARVYAFNKVIQRLAKRERGRLLLALRLKKSLLLQLYERGSTSGVLTERELPLNFSELVVPGHG